MLENVRTIDLLEWCSGQKVNWEKSALCGVNVDGIELYSVVSKLNCKATHRPFMYLGLPLGGHPKKKHFGNR